MDKRKLNKQIKLELMRYCLLWNMTYESSKEYFKTRGYKLSQQYWAELKNQINSDEDTKFWFSEQALKAMEKDHKLSVQQYDEMERILLNEISQLTLTKAYLIEGKDSKGDPIYVENENHDVIKLTRVIQTFDLIKKSKSDALMANPIVQAIMVKHEKELELTKTSHASEIPNGIPIPATD